MRFKISLGIAIISLFSALSPASASTFLFERDNLKGNNRVGEQSNITTSFNAKTNLLKWSSTFERNQNNGRLADGAWFVLSEGVNPKKDVDEYAIFFLDGINEKVSIYNYMGKVGKSYKKGTYLGQADLMVNNEDDARTFSFSLNATDINQRTDFGADWKGVLFGEKIGIWFHGVDDLEVDYNDDHSLSTFKFPSQGWYDRSSEDTVKVPEPMTIAGLGLVALGATRLRRRQS